MAGDIMRDAPVVPFVTGKRRRRWRFVLIQPIGQAIPDAIEIIAACIVCTGLELGISVL